MVFQNIPSVGRSVSQSVACCDLKERFTPVYTPLDLSPPSSGCTFAGFPLFDSLSPTPSDRLATCLLWWCLQRSHGNGSCDQSASRRAPGNSRRLCCVCVCVRESNCISRRRASPCRDLLFSTRWQLPTVRFRWNAKRRLVVRDGLRSTNFDHSCPGSNILNSCAQVWTVVTLEVSKLSVFLPLSRSPERLNCKTERRWSHDNQGNEASREDKNAGAGRREAQIVSFRKSLAWLARAFIAWHVTKVGGARACRLVLRSTSALLSLRSLLRSDTIFGAKWRAVSVNRVATPRECDWRSINKRSRIRWKRQKKSEPWSKSEEERERETDKDCFARRDVKFAG